MDSAFADYGANNAISDSSIFDELKDWYWRGSYVQSLSFLDSLDKDETLVANPKYWQIRGYVYKDLYKYDRALTKAGRLRKQAIQSYLRAMEISADTEEEIHNNSIKALKYLSSTLYNDAARTLDEFDVDKALSLFEDYIYIAENVLKIDKGKLNDRRIDVNLFAASKVLQFMDYL
ncbi:hypothetical protein N8Z47_06775, partial [Salibacteraceae bacterium]|nr:hypothetical protein [Salibacteraceae bacterium]